MKSVMNNTKRKRGDFGEKAVCDYIIAHGYEIIARNYRKPFGEIDIIAFDGDEIVFIEVKTRKFAGMTDGIDSITLEKRRKITKTARVFLKENPRFHGINARFDAAEVIVTTDDAPDLLEIEYYKNAFEAMFNRPLR
jgi:putative endonuclease